MTLHSKLPCQGAHQFLGQNLKSADSGSKQCSFIHNNNIYHTNILPNSFLSIPFIKNLKSWTMTLAFHHNYRNGMVDYLTNYLCDMYLWNNHSLPWPPTQYLHLFKIHSFAFHPLIILAPKHALKNKSHQFDCTRRV